MNLGHDALVIFILIATAIGVSTGAQVKILRKTLKIALDSDATVAINDNLTFVENNGIKVASCDDTEATDTDGTIIISGDLEKIKPTVTLQESIEICGNGKTKIRADVTRSGRKSTFVWTVEATANTDLTHSDYLNELQKLASAETSGLLEVDNSKVPNEIQVKVKVINCLNVEAESNPMLVRVTSSQHVQIYVKKDADPSTSTIIRANFESCSSTQQTEDLQFVWSISPSIEEFTFSNAAIQFIKPGFLHGGVTYTVYVEESSTKTSAISEFVTNVKPLIAKIQGSDSQDVSVDHEIELVSESRDPSNVPIEAVCTWSCQDEETKKCSSVPGGIFDVSRSCDSVKFSAIGLGVGMKNISLLFSVGNRSAIANKILIVKSVPIPDIRFEIDPHYDEVPADKSVTLRSIAKFTDISEESFPFTFIWNEVVVDSSGEKDVRVIKTETVTSKIPKKTSGLELKNLDAGSVSNFILEVTDKANAVLASLPKSIKVSDEIGGGTLVTKRVENSCFMSVELVDFSIGNSIYYYTFMTDSMKFDVKQHPDMDYFIPSRTGVVSLKVKVDTGADSLYQTKVANYSCDKFSDADANILTKLCAQEGNYTCLANLYNLLNFDPSVEILVRKLFGKITIDDNSDIDLIMQYISVKGLLEMISNEQSDIHNTVSRKKREVKDGSHTAQMEIMSKVSDFINGDIGMNEVLDVVDSFSSALCSKIEQAGPPALKEVIQSRGENISIYAYQGSPSNETMPIEVNRHIAELSWNDVTNYYDGWQCNETTSCEGICIVATFFSKNLASEVIKLAGKNLDNMDESTVVGFKLLNPLNPSVPLPEILSFSLAMTMKKVVGSTEIFKCGLYKNNIGYGNFFGNFYRETLECVSRSFGYFMAEVVDSTAVESAGGSLDSTTGDKNKFVNVFDEMTTVSNREGKAGSNELSSDTFSSPVGPHSSDDPVLNKSQTGQPVESGGEAISTEGEMIKSDTKVVDVKNDGVLNGTNDGILFTGDGVVESAQRTTRSVSSGDDSTFTRKIDDGTVADENNLRDGMKTEMPGSVDDGTLSKGDGVDDSAQRTTRSVSSGDDSTFTRKTDDGTVADENTLIRDGMKTEMPGIVDDGTLSKGDRVDDFVQRSTRSVSSGDDSTFTRKTDDGTVADENNLGDGMKTEMPGSESGSESGSGGETSQIDNKLTKTGSVDDGTSSKVGGVDDFVQRSTRSVSSGDDSTFTRKTDDGTVADENNLGDGMKTEMPGSESGSGGETSQIDNKLTKTGSVDDGTSSKVGGVDDFVQRSTRSVSSGDDSTFTRKTDDGTVADENNLGDGMKTEMPGSESGSGGETSQIDNKLTKTGSVDDGTSSKVGGVDDFVQRSTRSVSSGDDSTFTRKTDDGAVADENNLGDGTKTEMPGSAVDEVSKIPRIDEPVRSTDKPTAVNDEMFDHGSVFNSKIPTSGDADMIPVTLIDEIFDHDSVFEKKTTSGVTSFIGNAVKDEGDLIDHKSTEMNDDFNTIKKDDDKTATCKESEVYCAESDSCILASQNCSSNCTKGQVYCHSMQRCISVDESCDVKCDHEKVYCSTTDSCISKYDDCKDPIACIATKTYCPVTKLCIDLDEMCEPTKNCTKGQVYCRTMQRCISAEESCDVQCGHEKVYCSTTDTCISMYDDCKDPIACIATKTYCPVTDSCIDLDEKCERKTVNNCKKDEVYCRTMQRCISAEESCDVQCDHDEVYCSTTDTCIYMYDDCKDPIACIATQTYCPITDSCIDLDEKCERKTVNNCKEDEIYCQNRKMCIKAFVGCSQCPSRSRPYYCEKLDDCTKSVDKCKTICGETETYCKQTRSCMIKVDSSVAPKLNGNSKISRNLKNILLEFDSTVCCMGNCDLENFFGAQIAAAFGPGATADVKRNTMKITLGVNSSIKFPLSLTFIKNNSITTNCCGDYVEAKSAVGTVEIKGDLEELKPAVSLPSDSNICGTGETKIRPLEIVRTGGKAVFVWTIESTANTDATKTDDLNELKVTASNEKSGILVLDNQKVPNEIRVKLKIINHFNLEAESNPMILTVSGKQRLSLRVKRNVNPSNPTYVIARFESCDPTANSIPEYLWSITPPVEGLIFTNSGKQKIEAGMLNGGQIYTISAEEKISKVSVQAEFKTTVKPLLAKIKGSDSQDVSINHQFRLVSESEDPSNVRENASCTWMCRDADDKPCKSEAFSVKLDSISCSDAVVVTASSLGAGRYEMTLIYRKGAREANATKMITIKETPVPVIEFEVDPPYECLPPGKSATLRSIVTLDEIPNSFYPLHLVWKESIISSSGNQEVTVGSEDALSVIPKKTSSFELKDLSSGSVRKFIFEVSDKNNTLLASLSKSVTVCDEIGGGTLIVQDIENSCFKSANLENFSPTDTSYYYTLKTGFLEYPPQPSPYFEYFLPSIYDGVMMIVEDASGTEVTYTTRINNTICETFNNDSLKLVEKLCAEEGDLACITYLVNMLMHLSTMETRNFVTPFVKKMKTSSDPQVVRKLYSLYVMLHSDVVSRRKRSISSPQIESLELAVYDRLSGQLNDASSVNDLFSSVDALSSELCKSINNVGTPATIKKIRINNVYVYVYVIRDILRDGVIKRMVDDVTEERFVWTSWTNVDNRYESWQCGGQNVSCEGVCISLYFYSDYILNRFVADVDNTARVDPMSFVELKLQDPKEPSLKLTSIPDVFITMAYLDTNNSSTTFKCNNWNKSEQNPDAYDGSIVENGLECLGKASGQYMVEIVDVDLPTKSSVDSTHPADHLSSTERYTNYGTNGNIGTGTGATVKRYSTTKDGSGTDDPKIGTQKNQPVYTTLKDSVTTESQTFERSGTIMIPLSCLKADANKLQEMLTKLINTDGQQFNVAVNKLICGSTIIQYTIGGAAEADVDAAFENFKTKISNGEISIMYNGIQYHVANLDQTEKEVVHFPKRNTSDKWMPVIMGIVIGVFVLMVILIAMTAVVVRYIYVGRNRVQSAPATSSTMQYENQLKVPPGVPVLIPVSKLPYESGLSTANNMIEVPDIPEPAVYNMPDDDLVAGTPQIPSSVANEMKHREKSALMRQEDINQAELDAEIQEFTEPETQNPNEIYP
ncbi:Uncharacterised protein g146 [Pycnogonum litorale]